MKNISRHVFLFTILFTTLLSISACARIKATRAFEQGKKFTKMEKYDQAIEEFEKVIALNPKHDQALEGLGLCYGKTGNYKPAAAYFEKALYLKPESKLYLMNLAVTYIKLERYADAKKIYLRILAIDKDNASAKESLKKIEKLGY